MLGSFLRALVDYYRGQVYSVGGADELIQSINVIGHVQYWTPVDTHLRFFCFRTRALALSLRGGRVRAPGLDPAKRITLLRKNAVALVAVLVAVEASIGCVSVRCAAEGQSQ
jgi:hypothetical protein